MPPVRGLSTGTSRGHCPHWCTARATGTKRSRERAPNVGRTMRSKIAALLAALFVAVSALAGCGGGAAEEEPAQDQQEEQEQQEGGGEEEQEGEQQEEGEDQQEQEQQEEGEEGEEQEVEEGGEY